MSDQLDELSNDELRVQLHKFGLANMPVTSTTRKVLIKRLRNVMTNGNPDTPSKPNANRRETIHVARFSSGDESDPPTVAATAIRSKIKAPSAERSSASRRATIGVTRAPSKEPELLAASVAAALPPASTSTPQTRRSSGRLTPLAAAADARAPIARAPEIITLDEDSDDEEPPVRAPPAARPATATRSPARRSSRATRSPSMGKSDTVVTSYMQIKAPAAAAIIEDEPADGSESDNNVTPPLHADTSGESSSFTRPPLPAAKPAAARSKDYVVTTSLHSSRSNIVSPVWPAATDRTMAGELRYEDAPYLSDFTRRLSRLRAEPLGGFDYAASPAGGSSLPRRRESVDRPLDAVPSSYRTSARVHGRQAMHHPVAVAKSSPLQLLLGWLAAVEQRYRAQIWPLVAAIVALFVFVMVFM